MTETPLPTTVTEHIQPRERYLWWLSFVDKEQCAPPGQGKPGGTGFLGVSIVSASSYVEAVRQAHRLGCNPGGEVQGYGPFPAGSIDAGYLDRLLTKEEVDDIPDPWTTVPAS